MGCDGRWYKSCRATSVLKQHSHLRTLQDVPDPGPRLALFPRGGLRSASRARPVVRARRLRRRLFWTPTGAGFTPPANYLFPPSGNTWDATLCPDPTTCAENCALDGADYEGTYGVSTSGNALTLDFVTGSNVGSRLYLMNAADSEYYLFSLLNQEFTFTVDVSKLGCGLNGAVYFSEMDADGGMSRFPGNKAGAKYGTGYSNILDWTPDSNSDSTGTGMYGTCCNEMDIWEANSMATAYTPHPCSVTEQTQCSGSQCGGASAPARYEGICDPDGCDFNSWRWGNETFFGDSSSFTIDTMQPITVVTQFVTSDGTSTGTLSAIKRLYVQNGKIIQNSMTNVAGVTATNEITDEFCTQQKAATNNTNSFATQGGLTQMGSAIGKGMVLSLSLWYVPSLAVASMLWLDSDYPTTSPASDVGVSRGPCATTSGVPANVESQQGSSSVIYSNIKFGPIGSTYSSGTSTTTGVGGTTTTTTTTSTGPTGSSVPVYGQCGGIGYTGSTTCASGSTCKEQNAYYSQCLPS
uniref:Glucanase n=1 Tax=Mycena chlorophos TaxID=658473 RepID=A0ABQ0L464_MYCCL|nr:glycoside hydrolase family 7 protein [Mycena chlorophos]